MGHPKQRVELDPFLCSSLLFFCVLCSLCSFILYLFLIPYRRAGSATRAASYKGKTFVYFYRPQIDLVSLNASPNLHCNQNEKENMGIRHQFWAIAKVGSRYRSLGVVHCQNAPGVDAIRACWRLLQIFGSSANETLIRHDCNCASTKTEDWWNSIANRFGKDVPLEDRVAFPFIHTCLFLGAAYDSRPEPDPFFFPVSAYETGISPMWLCSNNETGFTIIDITDRTQLRYCFMFPPPDPPISSSKFRIVDTEGKEVVFNEEEEEEEEIVDDPPRCRPMTAEEYFSCESTCRGYVYAKLNIDLSQWKLIPSHTLRELWPEVPWETENDGAACEQLVLEDLASRKVDRVDNQYIEEALDAGIKKAEALDLSPFPWLDEKTILRLVENNTDLRRVKSIDLSCNVNISVTTVEQLLRLCPNITTLTVVQTPNLPLETLGKALDTKKKSEIEIHHSDLFRAALENPMHYRREENMRLDTIPNQMAPGGTVGQIIFLSINREIAKDSSLRLKDGGLKWSELASFVQSLEGRSDFIGLTIPLHDAFLSPSRSGVWLSQLLQFFANNGATHDARMYRDGHASMGCACALAMNVKVSNLTPPLATLIHFVLADTKSTYPSITGASAPSRLLP